MLKIFNIVFLDALALIVIFGFICPWLISSASYELTALGVVIIVALVYAALRFTIVSLTRKGILK